MSVLKDFAGKYADVKSESDYGHTKMEATFIAGDERIAQNGTGSEEDTQALLDSIFSRP